MISTAPPPQHPAEALCAKLRDLLDTRADAAAEGALDAAAVSDAFCDAYALANELERHVCDLLDELERVKEDAGYVREDFNAYVGTLEVLREDYRDIERGIITQDEFRDRLAAA